MQRTKIEYLTHTWSPIAMRCTPISDGCDHCWHLRMANRLRGYYYKMPAERTNCGVKYQAYKGGDAWLNKDELSAPLRLKKPAVIGVQFMGDLFHEKVRDEMIAAVFGFMAACPQHRFAILTKRPERALKWFNGMIDPCLQIGVPEWPIKNVWPGVSIENQKTADERIPLLLQIPAAVRWVSAEPLLSHIDLERPIPGPDFKDIYQPYLIQSGIDWIVCGAETGHGKRPMNLDHARSLRDQCAAAGVPFFFKSTSDGGRLLDGEMHNGIPNVQG